MTKPKTAGKNKMFIGKPINAICSRITATVAIPTYTWVLFKKPSKFLKTDAEEGGV